MLTNFVETLVKQLKMERKEKISIKRNTFSSFKKKNIPFLKKYFLL